MARLALTDLAIQRLKHPEKGQITVWDMSLPGFGVRLSQRATSFVVMKGKERKLTTLGRYPDLTLKRARAIAKVELIQVSTLASKSFPDAVLLFKAASKTTTKSVTHGEYARYLDLFAFDKDVKEITMSDIRAKLKDLEGKPTAQNYAFVTMRVFMNWCLREGIIDRHPLVRVQLPNRLKSRDRVLTDAELKSIWEATDYKPFGHIVRILMLTGQRRGEIGSLQPGQVADTFNFSETKNGQQLLRPSIFRAQQGLNSHVL